MDNPYHESKIYKLTNPHTDKIYIGSTIQKRLSQRFQTHRQDYKNWKSGKDRKHTNSCFIFEASDNIFDTKVELIEEFKCETKKELWFREMEIINQHENCVNKMKGQTLDPEYNKKYCQENKDKISQQRKKKRQENLEEFRKKDRERYERDKERIDLRNKKYREENSKKYSESKKKYYTENREEMLKRVKEYQDEKRKDPEWVEKKKEYKRQWYLNNKKKKENME